MSTPRNCAAFVLAASLLATPIPAAPEADNDGNSGTRIVVTEDGPVRGIAAPTIYKFLGIPYAAPPMGELRWRPPQPHARWLAPLDATAFGSPCPQTGGPLAAFGAFWPGIDEDCLFLNVYAPRPQDGEGERRPVMVFIHGGGLTVDASNSYDPTPLVEKGGVLVVTINYRLGILGFLSHPALTAESPYGSSGNYGLMDQQAALRWVHANIARFGGDPENVTIFGESSGGVSVHANLASPSAAGLFHKAIIESGAISPYAFTEPSLADSEALGTVIAELLGCSSQTAACLRALSVPTILAVQDQAFSNIITPSVDGKVLPLSTGVAFATGQFNRVPVIEGSNHDEYRFFVGETELLTGTPLSAAGYIPTIEADLGVPATTAAYLGTYVYPLAAYPSPSIAMGALGTDAVFACNARALAGLLAQYVPTYQYEFNDPNAPIFAGVALSFVPGSYHSAEIQYLMGVDSRLLVEPGPQTPAQVELSDAMIQYWTRFARTGDPNSADAPNWPRYGASDLFQSLEPSTPVTKGDFAIDHKCAIWTP